MRGGAAGQSGSLLLGARLPQGEQQPGDSVRVVEGSVRGGAAGQSGSLLLGPCLP